MTQWLLVGVIVLSTVLGDLLQTIEMKRIGEVDDFRPGRIGPLLAKLARRRFLIAAVFFMAISFFAFMKLLSVADLSFAVPASAASVVVETILAKLLLKEQVDFRRWAGAGLVSLRCRPARAVIWAVVCICAVAAAYQILALLACLRHSLRKPVRGAGSEGISILKPVRGLHAGFEEAIRSHLDQSYPNFELLLGYRDPNDSAVPEMLRQQVQHFVCPQTAANAKVGVLMDLIERARNPIIIVNDADIVVPPNYLRDVTAPLADPTVGVVTCLYRAEGDSWPSRFEALGVATDFAPSALVAPWAGVSEFGFGSTLAFRRADLDAIGGFAAVSDYLADDYQIGARIHRLGRRNLISHVVVKTRLHADTWREVWSHQVRWARTIRLSRAGGYAGLPVTFATLWAVPAAVCGLWWIALGLLVLRIAVGIAAGWFVLRSSDVLKYFVLIPVRDLYGVAVWAAGLGGSTVEWGGRKLRLDTEGKIIE